MVYAFQQDNWLRGRNNPAVFADISTTLFQYVRSVSLNKGSLQNCTCIYTTIKNNKYIDPGGNNRNLTCVTSDDRNSMR